MLDVSFPAAMAAAAILVTGPVQAGVQPPGFSMMWDAGGDSAGAKEMNWSTIGDFPVFGEHVMPDSTRSWTGWLYTGTDSGLIDEWTLSWSVVFHEAADGVATGGGAFVTTHIVITNNLLTTQNFTSQLTLPLAKSVLSPMMRGEIFGMLTDLTLDEATLWAPTGSRIYTPRIDGFDESVGYLLSDPYELTAQVLSQAQVGPASFGVPALEAASRDATESIGMFLNFDLTAGDSVALIASLEILPVPAAGALPLLPGFGLLAGRRRRRAG